MHGAWWFRGPFVVPLIDTILTLLHEIYISIFWVKDMFNVKGIAKIPSSIPLTWVAPGNALGSVWLPVVYVSSFAILALHIWRMIVAAKHARNPFHPGVMHFVFGFSILAILGFAGVCGMLATDSLTLVNKFKTQVQCTPLAGALNQACVAARQFVVANRRQGHALLILTAVLGLFAIFGEMIIIWACLEACCFGPHIHCTVACGASGPGCGPCGGDCHPVAIACSPGAPPVVGCMSDGPCCPPVSIPVAPGCCPADGGCHPGGGVRATSGPAGTGPIRVGPVGGGSATSTLPPTKTSTATHTSHSNPCHASCPVDADTQQRTAVENPVANTCQISINTGRQEKGKRTRRRGHVVMDAGSSSRSSSSDDDRCVPVVRTHPPAVRLRSRSRPTSPRARGCTRPRCESPGRRRSELSHRRRPEPSCSASPSASPFAPRARPRVQSPHCRPPHGRTARHPGHSSRRACQSPRAAPRTRRPCNPSCQRASSARRSPQPSHRRRTASASAPRMRRGQEWPRHVPSRSHSPPPPPAALRRPPSRHAIPPRSHSTGARRRAGPYPRSLSPVLPVPRGPPARGRRFGGGSPLPAASPMYEYGAAPCDTAAPFPASPAVLPFSRLAMRRSVGYPLTGSPPLVRPYPPFPRGPVRSLVSRPGPAFGGKPPWIPGLDGEPLILPPPAGPPRNTFLTTI